MNMALILAAAPAAPEVVQAGILDSLQTFAGRFETTIKVLFGAGVLAVIGWNVLKRFTIAALLIGIAIGAGAIALLANIDLVQEQFEDELDQIDSAHAAPDDVPDYALGNPTRGVFVL